MTTIDQIDNEWYYKHALDVQALEDTYKNYLRVRSLDEARAVQPHTWIETLEVQVPMLDLLMGLYSAERKTIAFFSRPYSTQRRSPFNYFLIAPTLGSLEKQEADSDLVKSILIRDEEGREDEGEEEDPQRENKLRVRKRRKTALERMYDTLEQLNMWLLEIKGKQSQYQKG